MKKPPETWTELLGPFDAKRYQVDGCCIVQLISTGGKYIVQCRFETGTVARAVFEAWSKEVT